MPKPQELARLSRDVVTVGFLFHTETIVMFKNKKFENPMSFSLYFLLTLQSKKEGKIRNRYNQAPYLTQDANAKVSTLQLDIKNESQEVSPFPAGDHKAPTNRRA